MKSVEFCSGLKFYLFYSFIFLFLLLNFCFRNIINFPGIGYRLTLCSGILEFGRLQRDVADKLCEASNVEIKIFWKYCLVSLSGCWNQE